MDKNTLITHLPNGTIYISSDRYNGIAGIPVNNKITNPKTGAVANLYPFNEIATMKSKQWHY